MSILEKSDLTNIIYDPLLVQKKVLDMLTEFNADEMTVSDPTNPFIMLLEASACIASSSIEKCQNELRKTYPSLASSTDELYHHITDNQLTSMFATPGDVNIVFYVNVQGMKNYGYRPTDANYTEITIPKYTVVTILDTDLTLLNDIVVRYYNNGTSYVEQQTNSENDLAYEDLGVLNSAIYSDSNGNSWIIFVTKIKQITMYTATKSITPSNSFSELVTITDDANKYVSSLISFKNTATGNSYVQLSRGHNDEFIDSSTPTAFISVYDGYVQVKIPDVYIIDGIVSGTVKMEIFTTKGNLFLPINKYETTDFSITLGDTSSSSSHAAATKVSIVCNSLDEINDGVDAMTLSELRTSIIENTTGDIDLPITDQQVERMASLYNYTITKATDVLTNRLYIALRSLSSFEDTSGLIYARQDVFFNTCKLVISEVENYDSVVVNDDTFLIKSNSIFKLDNGRVFLCSPEQIEYLDNLTNAGLIEHLSGTKYFYNPYYYLIDITDDYSSVRVYDLDTPTKDSNKIIANNTTVDIGVNLSDCAISKTTSGYRIIFKLTTSTEFDNLDPDSIILQLKIPLYDGNDYVYFNAKSEYDDSGEIYYYVDIETNMDINSDNQLDIQNGTSSLSTKRINLSETVYLYTITTDTSAIDPSSLYQSELYNNTSDTYVVLTKESITLTFGTYLEYIYTKLYSVYNDRKYKTYLSNVVMTYDEDVYEVNSETGSIYISFTENNGTTEASYNLLHAKGDIVYEDDGITPVYAHKIGDVVLDENGEPTIDTKAGVTRYIEMLLLEYEFYKAKSTVYENYKSLVLDELKGFIVDDMETMNEKMLDNTTICYKSFKTAKDVRIVVNNTYETIDYLVRPKVTLYLTESITYSSDEIADYITTIGEIFNSHFENSTIVLEDIRSDIKTAIGSTVNSVKIENLDGGENKEIITIKEENVKLVLDKILEINKNSELVVKYNIDLVTQY